MEAFPFCGNYQFLVEVEELDTGSTSVVAGFAQVSGLSSESEVIEYRSGNDRHARKLPGRVSFGNLRLTRGVSRSTELWRWRHRIERGEADRRSGSVILLDAGLREKTRWNFYGAWPCRYEAPELDAEGSLVAVEVLELAVESLERVETSELAEETS